MTTEPAPACRSRDLGLRYDGAAALDAVTLDIPGGCMAGLIDRDSVGASNLLALIPGARTIQTGRIKALGGNMAEARHRDVVGPRIAYRPQGLGKNLHAAQIGAWIDEAMPMRAETVRGYVEGMHAHWLKHRAPMTPPGTAGSAFSIETRFRYNPDVRSPPAIMPAMIPVLLLIPAMLAACSVSLGVIVQGLLAVPIEGSLLLLLAGCAIHLFAIGAVLFGYARSRFRASVTRMA